MDKYNNKKELSHLGSILNMLIDVTAEMPEVLETEAEQAVKENMDNLKKSLEILFLEKFMDRQNSTFYRWCLGYTHEDQILEARSEERDVISEIISAAFNDSDRKSDKLLASYQEASVTERAIMDQVLA